MALTKPSIVDDPLQARPPAAAQPALERPPSAPAAARDPRVHTGSGDPYEGSPKVTVSMRATKELWDGLGMLSRRLEDEGMRTSRTEITEALWHFHAPQTAREARDLVQRYRRVRLG